MIEHVLSMYKVMASIPNIHTYINTYTHKYISIITKLVLCTHT